MKSFLCAEHVTMPKKRQLALLRIPLKTLGTETSSIRLAGRAPSNSLPYG
jgi:hypothetical protein